MLNHFKHTTGRHTLMAAALLIATVAALSAPDEARAGDLILGAEASYGAPSGDWAETTSGGAGLQLRLGYALPVPGIRLIPEVLGMQQEFGTLSDPQTPAAGDVTGYSAFIGAAGLRVGLEGPISPAVFGHYGFGELESVASGVQQEGTYYDVGAALDLTILPLVNVGVHGSYHVLEIDTDAARAPVAENAWTSFGAHLEVVF